jgi:hypothetical protein
MNDGTFTDVTSSAHVGGGVLDGKKDVVRLGRLARLQQRRTAGLIRLQLLQVGSE